MAGFYWEVGALSINLLSLQFCPQVFEGDTWELIYKEEVAPYDMRKVLEHSVRTVFLLVFAYLDSWWTPQNNSAFICLFFNRGESVECSNNMFCMVALIHPSEEFAPGRLSGRLAFVWGPATVKSGQFLGDFLKSCEAKFGQSVLKLWSQPLPACRPHLSSFRAGTQRWRFLFCLIPLLISPK